MASLPKTILPPVGNKPAPVVQQKESRRCDPQIITAVAIAIILIMATISFRYIFDVTFFSQKIFSILETSQVIYLGIGILTVGYILLKIKKNFTLEVPELDSEPTAKRKPEFESPVSRTFPSLGPITAETLKDSASSRVTGAHSENRSSFFGGWGDRLSGGFRSNDTRDSNSIHNGKGTQAKKIDIDGSGDNNNCLLHAILSNMKEMNQAALAKGAEQPWQPGALFSNGVTFSTATPEDFHTVARNLRTTIGEEGLHEWYNGFASFTPAGQPTAEAGFYKKWSCSTMTFESCKIFLDNANTESPSHPQILENVRCLRAHIEALKSSFKFIPEWDEKNSQWINNNIFEFYDKNVSLWFFPNGTFDLTKFQSFREFIERFKNNISPLVNGYHYYSPPVIHNYLLKLMEKIPNIQIWDGQKYIENSCIWEKYNYQKWFRDQGKGTLKSEEAKHFRSFVELLKNSIMNLPTLNTEHTEIASRIFTIEDEHYPLYEMHFLGLNADELRKKREWFDTLLSSLGENIAFGETVAPELAALLPPKEENIALHLRVGPAERVVKKGIVNENTVINFLNGITNRPLQLTAFSIHQLCLHFKIEIVWFRPNNVPHLVNPLNNTRRRFYIHNSAPEHLSGGHWTCIDHLGGEELYQDFLQNRGSPRINLAMIY